MRDAFDFETLVAPDLPAPALPWKGFPTYNFIGGHNDPESIPVDGLIAAAERVLRRKGRALATYNLDSGPLGFIELREFLSNKLAAQRGVKVGADEVLIVSGSGQAIELVNRVLLSPGDTVICEQYSYASAINRMRGRGANVISLPLDEHGLRTDALANILDDCKKRGIKPKYLYTIPTIQNPTGSVLPIDRRRQVLEMTRAHGVAVFEDECYADLLWDGDWPQAMRGMDGGEHVIHIGSFSKYLAPALRLGYAVAPWPLMRRLLSVKSDGGTGALGQMIVAEYLRDHYGDHVAALKVGLKRKLDALVAALEEHFGTAAEYTVPGGGIFLWVKLPPQVDTAKLVAPAAGAGIAFNPGPEWSVDKSDAQSHLRLCFALPSEEEIAAGVAKLSEVCFAETGIPAQSANVVRGDAAE